MDSFTTARRAASGALIVAAFCARSAPALDVETAMREVAAANPTIAARTAMTEAARRRVARAGAWQNPTLELGFVNVPTTGEFDIDPMTMKMVGVAQRVPLSGSLSLARRSADRAARAEDAAAEWTAYELFGETWSAYATTWYAGERVRLVEHHREIMDRMVATARSRYEAGGGRLDDLLRVEAERARVLADRAAFQAEERAARARLDELRGRDAGAAPDSLAPPPTPPPAAEGAWRAAVDARHPRLRELDARAEGYRLAARSARRMVWPDLELRGSYGRRENLVHGSEHPQYDMWSASVMMMLPVFAGRRELAEGAEMDAMARAGASERRAAELELSRQVIELEAQAGAADRGIHLVSDTVLVTLRKALDASWSAYAANQTELWRVFETAHALYDEEVGLTRTRQQLAAAQARLVAITGRGDLLGITLPVPRRSS